jgi:glycosyltransferase involved in cell wall biosynthesis
MIVRNEAHCILRCLNSYKDSIDLIAIVDTGSTDDTINIINNFINESGIPGNVISRPWSNFAIARNDSIDHAIKTIRKINGIQDGPITKDEMHLVNNCNWKLLVTDADNIIAKDDETCSNEQDALFGEYSKLNIKDYIKEDADFYQIPIIRGYSTRYVYTGLISITANGTKGSMYHCPIHEVVTPHGWNPRTKCIVGMYTYSGSHGGRGKYSCKSISDIYALENVIHQCRISKNDFERCVFYLAQSYRDLGSSDNETYSPYYSVAYHMYLKRAKMTGGSYEERYFSYLRCSQLISWVPELVDNLTTSQLEDIRFKLIIKCHQILPRRREALYDIMKICDTRKDNLLAWNIVKDHIDEEFTGQFILFVDMNLYGYEFNERAGLTAYYAGELEEFRRLNEKALSDPKIGKVDSTRLISNRKYYATPKNGGKKMVPSTLDSKITHGAIDSSGVITPEIRQKFLSMIR